jgi:hypothetical protein
MKVVSENSENDLSRKRWEGEVAWALRTLTANLIRITRGAGKPYEIVRQVGELIEALRGYYEAVGHWPPSDELGNALSFDSWEEFSKLSPEHQEFEYAKHTDRGNRETGQAGW